VGADAAARYDAVQMRMRVKILSPRMENGQKPNCRAQPASLTLRPARLLARLKADFYPEAPT
jgi:hypothetical protein